MGNGINWESCSVRYHELVDGKFIGGVLCEGRLTEMNGDMAILVIIDVNVVPRNQLMMPMKSIIIHEQRALWEHSSLKGLWTSRQSCHHRTQHGQELA